VLFGRDGRKFGKFLREEEQLRIAARQHDDQLVDIGVAPAKAGRQRQRHWPQRGIDGAEEAGGKFRPGFRDQCNSVALLESQCKETPSMAKRILAQLGIGIGTHQSAASVVEVHPATALGSIVQRLTKRREISETAGKAVQSGRIAFKCKAGVDPDVPVEHAQILCNVFHEPGAWAGGPVLRGPFCLMVRDCGTNMAMPVRSPHKSRPPLTAERLEELALNYVGRFATSRSKLAAYLHRKLRERGWQGDGEPLVQDIADRMVRLGYVDDRAFALSKARSLTGRGYGERRVRQALMIAGIDEDQGAEAHELAATEAVGAALKFASRRSIGPYRANPSSPQERERAIAAMVRAGHRFALAKAITDLNPGENPDFETLFNLR